MVKRIVNSSIVWRAIGLLKSTATYGRRTMRHAMICMCSALTSALACFVLALVVLPDIVTYRRHASKTQASDQNTRPGTIPIFSAGQIYLIQPDGSRTPVSYLYASSQLKAYADVLGAAAVWEKTKLPHTND